LSDLLEQMREMDRPSLLPSSGELKVAGLEEPVEVLFDRWGVPYVTAASLADLWFAQGFLSAGERLFQIDLLMRAARGRLSELFAERTLDDDRFARTVGFHVAGANYVRDWSSEDREMLGRFIEGVHGWMEATPALPLEYQLLDAEPAIARDLESWGACWAYLAWTLSGNAAEELLRMEIAEVMGEEAVERLMPPLRPTPPPIAAGGLAGRLLNDIGGPLRGQGSNNWVVAGSRSIGGKPLLANDPHLTVQQPAAWLEFHLSAPGYQARGVALPFLPGIALGTTAHHSWGVTNVSGDVQDMYVEELSPDGSAVRVPAGWEPLEIRAEEIPVRGASEPHVHEVRGTRHGPLLDVFPVGELDVEWVPLDRSLALRWTGLEFGVTPTTFLRVAEAGSFHDFREAVLGLRCPGQNFVYADVDGHIGYQCTGRYPVRRSGDGTMPVPGWTDEHEWTGWIDDSDLPWSLDPERGFLVTANNRMHGDDYPHLIGRDFHTPFRAQRITRLLAERDRHDLGSFAAIQTDTFSTPARTLIEHLARLDPPDDHGKDVLASLTSWDGDLTADSTGAAIYNAWIAALAQAVVPDPVLRAHYMAWRESFVCEALPRMLDRGDISGQQLLVALDEAIHEASGRTWGQIHRVRFAHPLASIPGLEGLFVAADHPIGGDEQTPNQGGMDFRRGYEAEVVASWRAIYDMGDLDLSVGVLTTGQSGHVCSPHWNDQSGMWAAGQHHPLPFTRGAVESAAESALRLMPG
jgi:penicillin amidase